MNLRPNQTVELKAVDAGPQAKAFRTKIQDVSNEQVAVIAPSFQDWGTVVRPNSHLYILLKSDDPKRAGRYRALAQVERRVYDTVPLLLLRIVSDWQRIQERNFVRVGVLLDANYVPIVDDKESEESRKCQVLDLSGGGLLMLTREKLSGRYPLRVTLCLDDQVISVLGSIRRVNEDVEEGYQYGLLFTDISEKDRQAIIQFVFQKQLELRRKGLTEGSI